MIKNWLVRGDTHGVFHWMNNGSLNNFVPDETAIIILGDAGFNFYLNKTDARLQKEVNRHGYRFYCVRGNHEARPQDLVGIEKVYDEDVEGFVYMNKEYPNIRYFLDFGEYTINGYKVAVIGGAYSVDKWYRLNRFKIMSEFDLGYIDSRKTGWFYNEQLSKEEMEECSELFRNKTYDFVFSHTCPYSWRPTDLFLNGIDQSSVDCSMELWMDKLKDEMNWSIWLFGHYHRDRLERPYVEMYFNDIENLDDIRCRWDKYSLGIRPEWWLERSPNFYS